MIGFARVPKAHYELVFPVILAAVREGGDERELRHLLLLDVVHIADQCAFERRKLWGEDKFAPRWGMSTRQARKVLDDPTWREWAEQANTRIPERRNRGGTTEEERRKSGGRAEEGGTDERQKPRHGGGTAEEERRNRGGEVGGKRSHARRSSPESESGESGVGEGPPPPPPERPAWWPSVIGDAAAAWTYLAGATSEGNGRPDRGEWLEWLADAWGRRGRGGDDDPPTLRDAAEVWFVEDAVARGGRVYHPVAGDVLRVALRLEQRRAAERLASAAREAELEDEDGRALDDAELAAAMAQRHAADDARGRAEQERLVDEVAAAFEALVDRRGRAEQVEIPESTLPTPAARIRADAPRRRLLEWRERAAEVHANLELALDVQSPSIAQQALREFAELGDPPLPESSTGTQMPMPSLAIRPAAAPAEEEEAPRRRRRARAGTG